MGGMSDVIMNYHNIKEIAVMFTDFEALGLFFTLK